MQRVIFVKSGVVALVETASISAVQARISQFDLALHDPFSVYQQGDVFSAERFAAAYSDMRHPFSETHAAPTIFSPTPAFNRAAFTEAGIQVNPHAHIRSDYVYAVRDLPDALDSMRMFGAGHGVPVPDYSLCEKANAPARFLASGFTLLETAEIRTKAALEEFPFDRIILKPSLSCDTAARGYILEPALYRIRTKAAALAELDALGAFSDPAILVNAPIIAQQVADGDGDNFDALILTGGVNGAGEVLHFSPIVLSTQFNEAARNVQSTWSPENDTEETRALQIKIEALIAGNRNCFYQIQFLRNGPVWSPHDFQYRMSYYLDRGLEQTGFGKYKVDIIKYVFDRSPNIPPQPASFALNLVGPRARSPQMRFSSGTTKAEALAALGA